jgi:hypothetical protein
VLCSSLIVGCKKDDGTSGDDTNTPDGPPALTGDKFTLEWGPVNVPPGEENTQCIVAKLSNDSAIKVHQLHNILGDGSHHVIVYRDDDPAAVENLTPTNCQPFAGALNLSGMIAPMMITQKKDDPLTLPDGVAYTLAAHQFIRIEMHYINTTDAAIMAHATTEFYAADPATIHDEANILFIGSPDINIPANGDLTVHQFFAPSRANLDLSTAKFFAITGHTHHLGTNVTVATKPTSAGTATMVYQPMPFVWSEPETTTHNPEFMVPTGGGFDFQCDYHNTTGQTVKFGESATAEMCFFWAYYYPSKGSHVCVHTEQFGGIDICCPEAGAQVCNMLNQPG